MLKHHFYYNALEVSYLFSGGTYSWIHQPEFTYFPFVVSKIYCVCNNNCP